MRIPVVLLIMLLTLVSSVSAQDKCGTVTLQQMQLGDKDFLENQNKFEKWLTSKMDQRNSVLAKAIGRVGQISTIPVVVHVVHNGESLGQGGNIPDAQVFSQIDILNKDFRRLNADTVETPDIFKSRAADTSIEFVLAKQDPEGLPTTGILRVQGSKNQYRLLDDELLKSESFWPPEDYLNIWVTDLGNDLLGYAQFPVSNLEGLQVDRSNNRLTDGVVVDFAFFGTGFNTDPFSQGRTATHEIGHYLGLRHVWGDGGCSIDDFCSDTPPMGDSTSGCPNEQNTCETLEGDMFQNYMDFSDDVCMNLFTKCQSNRMQTVLSESPRRRSLLLSKGGDAPIVASDDIGIRQIISPEVSNCTSSIVPEIEIRNYGDNLVESFRLDLEIDGEVIQTVESSVSIQPLGLLTIPFQAIEVEQGQELIFGFRVVEVNGIEDGNPINNLKTIFSQVPFESGFPIIADFEEGSDMWMKRRLSGDPSDWNLANAPLDIADNQAFKIDIFGSTAEDFGNLEMLVSPVIDLEKVTAAELQFEYAYAPVSGNFIDGLTVAVLTECGVNFNPDNIAPDFNRFGDDLATTTMKTNGFTPVGATEWSDATINLSAFLGQKNVQVALIAQNGGGNNIFVDNIELFANNQFRLDIKVTEITELPLVSCESFQAPIIEMKNFGIDTIVSIDYAFGANSLNEIGRIENLTLAPGQSQKIAVGLSNLPEGQFDFLFSVFQINDDDDDDPSDNSINQLFNITQREEILPLREFFEQRSFEELDWLPFSTTGPHNWNLANLNREGIENQAIGIEAFDLPEVGIQNWLVSPRLDLSQLDEASMVFEYSYANRLNRDDHLQIFVSTNCGRSFDHIVFDKTGSDLAVTSSELPWTPSNDFDWVREEINLSAFTGSEDVLIAFVFTNDNGNNIFIDNLDFFLTADPPDVSPVEETLIYPNPANREFNFTFNLGQKEDVVVRLVDMMGKTLFTQSLTDVLNQSYTYDASQQQGGLYLMQFIGESFRSTERVVIYR